MIQFKFQPKPEKGSYPELYPENSSKPMVAVNAGDNNLYVGGGSINKAFCRLLVTLTGVVPISANHHYGFVGYYPGFTELHKYIVDTSILTGEFVWWEKRRPNPKWANITVKFPSECIYHALGKRGEPNDPNTGFICLSIFNYDTLPHNNINNVGMLYVVGPRGKGSRGPNHGQAYDKDDFLRIVQDLGKNALLLINEYNKEIPESSHIKQLQWCLVSGGVYRHPDVSKIDVARATITGMLQVDTDIEVIFTWDEDVFRLAAIDLKV